MFSVTVSDGIVFNLKPLTVEQAESIYDSKDDPKMVQRRAVLTCINNAKEKDEAPMTMDELLKSPYSHYRKLSKGVLEVNEMLDVGEVVAAKV